jgi:hypothetical protein
MRVDATVEEEAGGGRWAGGSGEDERPFNGWREKSACLDFDFGQARGAKPR